MTSTTLASLKKLKQTGTALRNIGSYKGAMDTFDEVIKVLRTLEAGALSEEEARDCRVELADTYGMKGGTYRRWQEVTPNHLDLALQEYRKGLELEELDDRSTYNASNVITLAITREGKSPMDAELSQALNRVIDSLERDTREARADEWWAWSDLGQFYLLRNEPDKALISYRRALETGPTAKERRRHVEILRELQTTLKSVAPAISDHVDAIVKQLE